jgi:hypothetical protein
VVWQVAVQHPVARIVGDELDIARLSDPNQYGYFPATKLLQGCDRPLFP